MLQQQQKQQLRQQQCARSSPRHGTFSPELQWDRLDRSVARDSLRSSPRDPLRDRDGLREDVARTSDELKGRAAALVPPLFPARRDILWTPTPEENNNTQGVEPARAGPTSFSDTKGKGLRVITFGPQMNGGPERSPSSPRRREADVPETPLLSPCRRKEFLDKENSTRAATAPAPQTRRPAEGGVDSRLGHRQVARESVFLSQATSPASDR